jgi:hypothetical protein
MKIVFCEKCGRLTKLPATVLESKSAFDEILCENCEAGLPPPKSNAHDSQIMPRVRPPKKSDVLRSLERNVKRPSA